MAKTVLLLLFTFALLQKHSRAEVERDVSGSGKIDSIREVSGVRTNFANFSAYFSFLDDVFSHLSSSHNVSEACRFETSYVLKRANDGDSNALRILDSVGKPSSGLLEGGVFFIGFYSECVTSFVNISHIENIAGQYCLINFNFSASEQILPQALWQVIQKNQKPPTVGICIPSSCSTSDLNIATSLSLMGEAVDADVAVCHGNPKSIHKDIGAIVILCIFVIFLLISIAGTAVEVVQEYKTGLPDSSSSKITNAKSVSREVLCEVMEPKAQKKSILVDCLLAFSFKRNAKKVFAVDGGGEGISCVHGLKFLSMALIIFGHTYSFGVMNLFMRNFAAAGQAPKGFITQLFSNGTLAVDTFYVISGLLVAYVTLNVMKKTDGRLPLLKFYFHRYFRLTPLMMMVVLISAYLIRYLGSGPNWMASIMMYDEWCRENGYLNALYLHNFIHTENMCLSHSWYLATDMQFYLVVPAILIPLHRNIKYGAIVAFIFLLATTVTTAVLTVVNHYPAIPYVNTVVPLNIINAYYKNVYIKPYCRMGPYIIGIFVGYLVLHKKELPMKRLTSVMLWTLSVFSGLTIIYLMYPANMGNLPTDSQAAAYSSLARTLWGVCIGWLIIACNYGYGGFINSILSWKPLIPLSRLTYCAYLIHPVVMNVHYGSTEALVDYSSSYMIYLFLGNICITFTLSLILSLMFESPFVALEKVILSKRS